MALGWDSSRSRRLEVKTERRRDRQQSLALVESRGNQPREPRCVCRKVNLEMGSELGYLCNCKQGTEKKNPDSIQKQDFWFSLVRRQTHAWAVGEDSGWVLGEWWRHEIIGHESNKQDIYSTSGGKRANQCPRAWRKPIVLAMSAQLSSVFSHNTNDGKRGFGRSSLKKRKASMWADGPVSAQPLFSLVYEHPNFTSYFL